MLTVEPIQRLHFSAPSLLTPLGDALDVICAAIEAGFGSYQSSDYSSGNQEPLLMSCIPEAALPELEESLNTPAISVRAKRMLRIAGEPLAALFSEMDDTAPLALILVAPEKIENFPTPIDDRFLSQLQVQSATSLLLEDSYVIPKGRAGFSHALEVALHLLTEKGHKQVVVGGVDCFHDEEYLRHLDTQRRLMAPGVKNGFAPGEGAGFFLVSLAEADQALLEGTRLLAVSESTEEAHWYSDKPLLAEGLSCATRQALQHAQPSSVTTVLSSANGEHFYARELGIILTRFKPKLNDEFSVHYLAEYFGDLGAASGPIQMALASHFSSLGPKNGAVLCLSSAELECRSALLIGCGNAA